MTPSIQGPRAKALPFGHRWVEVVETKRVATCTSGDEPHSELLTLSGGGTGKVWDLREGKA